MQLINNTINLPKYLIKLFEKVNTLDDAIKVYERKVETSCTWHHLRWSFVGNEFQLFGFNDKIVTFRFEE